MKLKLQLGRKASDILVSLYIIATLFVRMILEPQLNGHYLISVALGAFCLLFLWALIKAKLINPSFFGLWPGEEVEQA
ncbi:MAG: hypothetical protein HRU12_14710 [Phaeodactylibacter sp.]|nr:hypothetical protein [Phaeodactylibacter sp.]